MFLGNSDVIDEAGAPPAEREACTVLEALNRISGKWAIGILLNVSHGPVRFTELERAIPGISRRMLTLTLRNLERDGLLERTVHPTVPPKVEYRGTEMAAELYASLKGLTAWAERHRETIAHSREAYDREQGATGTDL
ncbi:helix-turn-helix domain-containing protein [Kitasatospora sp. NPDC002551]|uniref:winged helix-turn-helix transcriptional regulator n=1 Tax=unclassified Kitasatospora TaxID=2633591 RepID=UPI00291E90B2|nr:Slm13 [Streptomyces sp.]